MSGTSVRLWAAFGVHNYLTANNVSRKKRYIASKLETYYWFCKDFNCGVFPAYVNTIVLFTSFILKNIKPEILVNYLYAIQILHETFDFVLEFQKLVDNILKGAKKPWLQIIIYEWKSSPVTLNMLSKLVRFLDKDSLTGSVLRAAFSAGFWGMNYVIKRPERPITDPNIKYLFVMKVPMF